MGSSRFWLKAADEESKSIPHEFPRSHWLKATGQCVLERYLSATMGKNLYKASSPEMGVYDLACSIGDSSSTNLV